MIQRVIVWLCVATSAIATAQPAHAMALTTETGEYAIVTGLGGYLPGFNGPFYLDRWQLMVIGRVPTIVFTDMVYSPGRKELTFYQTWNGYTLYGLDSCAC